MKIDKNKVVVIIYNLEAEDQLGLLTSVETVTSDHPLAFIFGQSGFPEKFEEELSNLETGQDFKFMLSVEEAYGSKDDQSIVKLPKDIFTENGKFDAERFKEGSIVQMSDADGHVMPSRVLEVADTELLMDFNHPLAGFSLYFSGQVLEVRNASADELAHGHVHGPGGHLH